MIRMPRRRRHRRRRQRFAHELIIYCLSSRILVRTHTHTDTTSARQMCNSIYRTFIFIAFARAEIKNTMMATLSSLNRRTCARYSICIVRHADLFYDIISDEKTSARVRHQRHDALCGQRKAHACMAFAAISSAHINIAYKYQTGAPRHYRPKRWRSIITLGRYVMFCIWRNRCIPAANGFSTI